MTEDLAYTPAAELRAMIADKRVSPVELVELVYERIERLDGKLNAFLTLNREEATAGAREAEQAVMNGADLGPLHGVPISVKDLEMTKGLRTTGGSLVYKDRVPEVDSAVVERVRRSGAIIIGKTNTPEFGLLGHTRNRLGDDCRNPWDTSTTTGGSSGGAGAALAAGLGPLATGSDGGGSIRIPASFCGVYGIKPSQGRVPRYAGAPGPVSANQTSQSGPMSRTVLDSALLLRALAGHDPRDVVSLRDAPGDLAAATRRDVKGLRVGLSMDFGYAGVDPEVRDSVEGAAKVFEELGCSVENADLDLDHPYDTFMTVFGANSLVAYGALMESNRDDLTDYTRQWLEDGASTTGAQYASALGMIDRMKSKLADMHELYDIVLSPTAASTAFPVGEPPSRIGDVDLDPFFGYVQFTAVINLIGNPAASVPCGFSSAGLPIGLHIIGRPRDDATVIAASAAFERARPWADRRPPVS